MFKEVGLAGLFLVAGVGFAAAQYQHPHHGGYVYAPQPHYHAVPPRAVYAPETRGVIYMRPAPQAYPHGYYGQDDYSYRRVPRHGYQAYSYEPAPYRAYVPSAVNACARLDNPVSRQACECAVQFGGVAQVSGRNEVQWHDPRGGGGNLALQACKTQGLGMSYGTVGREIDPPGIVR